MPKDNPDRRQEARKRKPPTKVQTTKTEIPERQTSTQLRTRITFSKDGSVRSRGQDDATRKKPVKSDNQATLSLECRYKSRLRQTALAQLETRKENEWRNNDFAKVIPSIQLVKTKES